MVKGFTIIGDGWSIGHFIGTVPFGITPIRIDPIKPAGRVDFPWKPNPECLSESTAAPYFGSYLVANLRK